MQYLYSHSTQLLAGIQAPKAAGIPINSTNGAAATVSWAMGNEVAASQKVTLETLIQTKLNDVLIQMFHGLL